MEPVTKETVSLSQRVLLVTVGLLLMPMAWYGSIVVAAVLLAVVVVLLGSVRRTFRLEGGEARLGYGVFVPLWWKTLASGGVGEVSLITNSVSSGENSRRLVVDLGLRGTGGQARVWRVSWSRAAEARRFGEQIARHLGVPFRDLVGSNGLRAPGELDMSLRERIRRHNFQRQPLQPPPDVSLDLEGDDVVLTLPGKLSRADALLGIALGFPLMLGVTLVSSAHRGMRGDLDALGIGVIALFPVVVAAAAVHVARTDGAVRRLRLTPTTLVVERRLAWVIPFRTRVALDAIEDICIVEHGAIVGSLAIATDELVLAFGHRLNGKHFVAAYLAQWVAFAGDATPAGREGRHS